MGLWTANGDGWGSGLLMEMVGALDCWRWLELWTANGDGWSSGLLEMVGAMDC